MNERWIWTLRYAVVIALALVLGAALGEMDLFKASRLGKTGLNASHIARFLGFGGQPRCLLRRASAPTS
jgi:hypothetical protein